jgi:HEPN domain-containing protein
MRPEATNWLKGADYDLESARYMLSSQRYLYVVFLCHLALEKLLKALVSEVTQTQAPRSHDLVYLIKRSGISPDSRHMDFISIMNNASIITRYPEDFQLAIKEFSVDIAGDYLQKTEEVIKWLKQRPELNE